MSQLARTFLAQARTAIEGGDAQRAMDLLRRAKLMAGDDPALMARILDEMTRLAPQVGCESEGDVWHRQLEKLRSRGVPVMAGGGEDQDSARKPARFSPLTKTLIFAACLMALLIPGGIWFWHWSAGRYQSAGADSVDAIVRRQRLLKENIGLAMWFQRYEGYANGRTIIWNAPQGNGTAFAITSNGYLLTNKHVAILENEPPVHISVGNNSQLMMRIGLPTLMVCFGSDTKDHYLASISYISDRYDLAVLKISRRFSHPLKLSYRIVNQTEPIIACGFPGIVIDMDIASNESYKRLQHENPKMTGSFTIENEFPADVFKASATDGMIGSTNKMRVGMQYHQFNAKIAGGNSGGPLIAKNGDQVIGIVTLGGRSIVNEKREVISSEGYNYALALPQLKDELKRFVP